MLRRTFFGLLSGVSALAGSLVTSASAQAAYHVVIGAISRSFATLAELKAFVAGYSELSVPPEPEPVAGPEGHFDTIPDFSLLPGAVLIADGVGRVVAAGETFEADVIRVDGTLVIEGTLRVGTLVVGSGGQLLQRAGSEIVVRDVALDVAFDPFQFGTGVLCFGRWHSEGREPSAFVRHVGAIQAGATSLVLDAVPVDWRPGDRLILPDSRQVVWSGKPDRTFTRIEETTIESVVGPVVWLAAPTRFAHPAAPRSYYDDTVGGWGPHVIHATRDTSVRSENPSGTRGHVLVGDRADLALRGTAFVDLGRTVAELPLDSTTLDPATGAVSHVGTNQKGRYALHLHHLLGRQGVAAPAWRVEGCLVERASKWGYTIHDTHFGLLRNSVVYDSTGAGVTTEGHGDSFNVIEDNIACRIVNANNFAADHDHSGVETSLNNIAWEGSGFWFSGGNNYVRRNVACCAQAQGFVYNGYYWNKPTVVPLVPGYDHGDPSQYVVYGGRGGVTGGIPVLECRDNEAYGVGGVGHWFTWPATMLARGSASRLVEVHNPVAWHCMKGGFEQWHSGNVTAYNLVALNDPAVTSLNTDGRLRRSMGIEHGGGYEAWKARYFGGTVEGFYIGLNLAGGGGTADPSNPNEYVGVKLRNFINAVGRTVITGDGTPLRIVLRDVEATLAPIRWQAQGSPQSCHFWLTDVIATRAILNPVRIEAVNYNGQSFRPLWNEQRPDYVVPQNTNAWKGYPVAGLTNAQGWATYGKAVVGEVLPSAVSDPTLVGGGGFVGAL